MQEYMVIDAYDPAELSRAVTQALSEGWRAHGSLAVATRAGSNILYAQAMLRSNKDPDFGMGDDDDA